MVVCIVAADDDEDALARRSDELSDARAEGEAPRFEGLGTGQVVVGQDGVLGLCAAG